MIGLSLSDSASLPAVTPMRPMVMLTGFLGAGKTTFLRSVLQELDQKGYGADVILNDRENARIDRETLRDDARSIEALTGSCVCCDGLDQLYQLLLNASRTKHDVLLIELNGTADPVPLQETFILFEKHMKLSPRWQLCVVDARFFGERTAFADLEKLQLETASHFYLSHEDEVDEEARSTVLERVRLINPHASRTTVKEFAEDLCTVISNNQGFVMTTSSSEAGDVPSLPFDQKLHLHHRHHVAHEFTGCSIVFPDPLDEEKVMAWLGHLPAEIVRVKILLKLTSDHQSRFLFERVGGFVSPNPIPVRDIARVPCSGIFIGPEINPEEILQSAKTEIAPNCHFPNP
jgi:G3E family GTPase